MDSSHVGGGIAAEPLALAIETVRTLRFKSGGPSSLG
jgi:hypothetical protein